MSEFLRLKEVLKNSTNTQWHTYATKEERTHGFVIYGLENHPDEEEVKQDLRSKKINCKTVYKMKNTSHPLYVVITDNKTTLKDLEENAKTVQQVVVKWKKLLNKKEIIQCHKCQSWGHSATNCFSKSKCLKCAGQHLTSECELKKDNVNDQQKIKCANCGEKHLANSTECEVYQARKQHLDKIKAAAAEKKARKNVSYVPAPLPTTNPWNRQQIETPKVQNQPPTPAPTTSNNKEEQEASYSDLVQLMTEIRKLNELKVFLKMRDVDIMAVTETKLLKTDKIIIEGFSIIRKERNTDTRGGGVAILVKRGIPYIKAQLPVNEIECAAINLANKTTIVVAYNRPINKYKADSIHKILNSHTNIETKHAKYIKEPVLMHIKSKYNT
ncbi:hypothetical protein MTP99_019824 [Tenebrio molitor]|nr:hypothetical protein MTP99_019824 [Tenebrio molitor]